MRSTLLPFAALVLLAACGGAADGASSSKEAPGPAVASPPAATPTGSPAPPPVPGVDVVDTSMCPDVVARPTDCGPYAAACAGALPLAVGTFAALRSLAVSDDAVYWTAERSDLTPNCWGTIYRTPKAGGSSEKVVSGRQLGVMEADATTLYWSETGGSYHSLQGMHEVVIGTVPQVPSPGDPNGTTVGPVSGNPNGVFFQTNDAIWRAHPDSLEKVADVAFWIESNLAFDGVSLFAATDPYDAPSPAGRLARLGSTGDPVVVASNAAARYRRTVVSAGSDLFYVTGDDEGMGSTLLRPMGIYRVPADGSRAPVALVPPSNEIIESIVVDDAHVYFTVGAEIRAVPRAGGAPPFVVATLGVPPQDLHADGAMLYFRLDVRRRGGEISGPGNVIASLPKLSPK